MNNHRREPINPSQGAMELARHLMEWILYPQMNLSPFLHKPRQLRALGFPIDEGSRPQALFPLRAWRGQEEDELLGKRRVDLMKGAEAKQLDRRGAGA